MAHRDGTKHQTHSCTCTPEMGPARCSKKYECDLPGMGNAVGTEGPCRIVPCLEGREDIASPAHASEESIEAQSSAIPSESAAVHSCPDSTRPAAGSETECRSAGTRSDTARTKGQAGAVETVKDSPAKCPQAAGPLSDRVGVQGDAGVVPRIRHTLPVNQRLPQ